MDIARLSIIFCLLYSLPALSHEFWIEPQQYQVESGATLEADLKNGQNFKGSSQAWFEKRFTRFDIVTGETVRPVDGRMGDTPALQTTAPDDGLLIVAHETTDSTLIYREWEKFLTFAAHKDFQTAVETHLANGWPTDLFRETYSRHVKALIAIGDGQGQDRELGLETEFIALTNPYGSGFDGNMQVLVHYQGAPRPDAQVEVFERAPDGSVAVTLYRTNDDGLSTIPVLAGYEYLFDAVVLRPSDLAGSSEKAPVWETFWAALTFAVPAKN